MIRSLPNRVAIVVEERRPFTLVHAGRLHWIDEEGTGLGRGARGPSRRGMPVISGLGADELVDRRARRRGRRRRAHRLLRVLLRGGQALLTEISEIDMSRREGPVLYTLDGVEVRLGTEEWDERLGRLEGVLAQLARPPARP